MSISERMCEKLCKLQPSEACEFLQDIQATHDESVFDDLTDEEASKVLNALRAKR